MHEQQIQTGSDRLSREIPDWLQNRKIGLLTHNAARNRAGQLSLDMLLKEQLDVHAIYTPEHGLSCTIEAGEDVADSSFHGIPVYSLYGKTRRFTRDMLNSIDTILIDLQSLPFRFYTYNSTLLYAMEAAAENNLRIGILDRPTPCSRLVEGPFPETGCMSFVGALHTPSAFGMTSGELALLLKQTIYPSVDLHIFSLSCPSRDFSFAETWRPPSPNIPTPVTAWTYASLVYLEAFPSFDAGRGTPMAFQVIGHPNLPSDEMIKEMNKHALTGIDFLPLAYTAVSGIHTGKRMQGIRLHLTDPENYLPMRTGMLLLSEVAHCMGGNALWDATARPEFFNQLTGNKGVLEALKKNNIHRLFGLWRKEEDQFRHEREQFLLYP